MSIRSYMTYVEMIEDMQRNEAAATTRIKDWQHSVVPGNYVVRAVPSYNIVIYGIIIDPIENEKQYYDNLSDPEQKGEYETSIESYGDGWKQSYRFGKFYSILCVEGEYGDIHLSSITKVITREEFESAKQNGWRR